MKSSYKKKRNKDISLRGQKSKKNSYKFSIQSLQETWQVIFFTSVSCGLIALFINNAWLPISSNKVLIKGNQHFDKEEIIKASGLKFPKPLLEIIPKRIEANLIKKLSLQAVSIHRQIIPNQLFIEVSERTPIAYAQRQGLLGTENGMVDKSAEWIPIDWEVKDIKNITLYIQGWERNHRALVEFILLNQENLGSPLKQINITSNGEITLKTDYFDSINLGSNSSLLEKQLKILSHLSESLPSHFMNKTGLTIDLRDLSKPELQTGNAL